MKSILNAYYKTAVVEIRNFCERNMERDSFYRQRFPKAAYGEFFHKPQKQQPEVFYRKGALQNFAISKTNHLRWSLFLACSFIKTGLLNSCFPVNFEKLFRTSFSQNTSRRLLLKPL